MRIDETLSHQNYYMIHFQIKTPRPMVELSSKPRKILVKKPNFNCFGLFIFLRTFATNSWYFDSGCSRHIIGNQNIFGQLQTYF